MNIEELKLRAAAGDAEAQFELGICYLNGEDIKLDEEAAVLWFKKSAEKGYAEAQSALGECYHFGEGVEQDFEEAVKWWRLATEQGNSEAQNNLGYAYKCGEGETKWSTGNFSINIGWDSGKDCEIDYPVAAMNIVNDNNNL